MDPTDALPPARPPRPCSAGLFGKGLLQWRAFFDGWSPIVRTVVLGVLSYAALVAMLRVSGKRTLAKMNAFDLVVTVAFGSTLASILMNRDVSLVQGVVTLAMLIGLQYAVAWSAAHSTAVGDVVKSTPTVLLWQGEVLRDVCRRERVAVSEVRAAVRLAGMASLAEAHAVVLETTGDLSVVKRSAQGDHDPSALEGINSKPGDGGRGDD